MKISQHIEDQEDYDKTLDEEGFIVELDNQKQRVLTPKGEEIHIDEWGGIMRGSEAFVKSDTFSLMEIAKKLDEDSFLGYEFISINSKSEIAISLGVLPFKLS